MKKFIAETNTKYAKLDQPAWCSFPVDASSMRVAIAKAAAASQGNRESGRATWMQVTLRELGQ